MNTRSRILAVLAVLVVLVLLAGLRFWLHDPAPSTVPAQSHTRPASQMVGPDSIVAARTAEGLSLYPGAEETAKSLHSAASTVEEDISIVQDLMAMYRRTNGGVNPAAGSNAEFTAILRGDNAKRLVVFPPELTYGEDGGLLDRWGTPYFFHPLSEKVIEIRSAGPDRAMWTDDDVHPEVPEVQGLLN